MCFCGNLFTSGCVCVKYALNVKGKSDYGFISCNVLFVLSDADSDIYDLRYDIRVGCAGSDI